MKKPSKYKVIVLGIVFCGIIGLLYANFGAEDTIETYNTHDTINHNPNETADIQDSIVFDSYEIADIRDSNLLDSSGTVGGRNYVDLGLPSGTLWATYNVGASAPTEGGDYFAWGETKPKTDFSWDNYKWGTKKHATKYCTEAKYGVVDGLTVLSAADDAATENWGCDWRMPMSEEINELINSCEWEHTKDFQNSGVEGMIGTSLYNRKKVFFPVTKIMVRYHNSDRSYHIFNPENSEGIEKGHDCLIKTTKYFSKELEEKYCHFAMGLSYNEIYGIFQSISVNREMGNTIRAVCTKKIEDQEKEVLKIFKDANGLEADSVAEFRVVGNYKKQSLTISGYYNRTADWTYSHTDALVADSVLYMMVRGVDQKANLS